MTLIVGRTNGKHVTLVADTLITQNGAPLKLEQSIVKTCAFPFGICVGFSGSTEHAKDKLWRFSSDYKQEPDYGDVISYFEKASVNGHCDFLIAFANTAKLAKIVDGKKQHGLSQTQWIGDQAAYLVFREVEVRIRKRIEYARAVSNVFVWNEPDHSPTSDLYSTMRQVAMGRYSPFVGPLTTVMSSIDGNFRTPSITDALYDWPGSMAYDLPFDYNEKVALTVSGENKRQSTNIFGSAYSGINVVGFYFLAGKLALIFHPRDTLLADTLTVIRDVEPEQLPARITTQLGVDFGWQIVVASAESITSDELQKEPMTAQGMAVAFRVHCNTFPPTGVKIERPTLVLNFPRP